MKIVDSILSKLLIPASEPEPKRHGRGILRSLVASISPTLHYPPEDLSLAGKVALVTGATSGLGLEACRHLLTQGVAQLIMSARSENSGVEVANQLSIEFPNAKIEVWDLEMESYKSVCMFAHRVNRDLTRLDMVILNAGFLTDRCATSEYTRHEKMFQVNYLSTALLCVLLLPALKHKAPAGKPGRLTVVSKWIPPHPSITKPTERSFFDYLDNVKTKDGFSQHLDTKVLGFMFVTELAKQVPCDDVIINAVDPGPVRDTGLWKSVQNTHIKNIVKFGLFLGGRTLSRGALTYIDAVAVEGTESHGKMLMNFGVLRKESRGKERKTELKAQREKLWEETLQEFESIVGDLDMNETGRSRLGRLQIGWSLLAKNGFRNSKRLS